MISDEDIDLEISHYMTGQAEDDALDFMMKGPMSRIITPFGNFFPAGAVGLLRKNGILLTGHNVTTLGTLFQMFSRARPELYAKKTEIKKEKRISEVTSELCELLKDIHTDSGWRYVWGDSERDPDEEKPEPEDYTSVPELVEHLDILKRSADERAEALEVARTASFFPAGNRVIWDRHFYWIILLVFWRDVLKRDIGTSTREGVDSYGPLIRFIRILSLRGWTDDELSGEAIRSWIRTNKDRLDDCWRFVTPD